MVRLGANPNPNPNPNPHPHPNEVTPNWATPGNIDALTRVDSSSSTQVR